MKSDKKDKIQWGAAAVVVTVILWFACLKNGNVYPFGENSILAIDLSTQYSQFFMFMKNTPPSQWIYSFSKGFGGNTFAVMLYYCISVFNVFIFMFDSIETSVFVIITAKFAFMTLCMYIYMANHSNNNFINGVAAVCYSFFPYFLFYYSNVIWFDCFALFPLLVLFCEKTADGHKTFWFTVVYTYCIYSNYYLAGLCSVFILIYFFRYSFTEKGYEIKYVLKRAFAMAWAAGISILLSAPVLIPSFSALGQGKMSRTSLWRGRGGGMFSLTETIIHSIDSHWNIDTMPVLFCGMAGLCLIIYYIINPYVNKRKKRKNILLMAAVFLMMQIPQLYYMWSGFTWPQGFGFRVIFCLSFVICTAVAQGMENFCGKSLFISAVISVLFGVAVSALTKTPIEVHVVIPVALLCAAAVLPVKKKYIASTVIWFAYMAVYGVGILRGQSEMTYVMPAHTFENKVEELNMLLETGDDRGFFRTEDTDSLPFNQPMARGYNGTTHFSSLYDEKQKEMYVYFGYEDLFYRTEYTHSYPYSDSFFGIRYLFNKQNPIPSVYTELCRSQSGIVLYENPYRIPVFFGADVRHVPYSQYWVEYINNMYIALTGVDTLNKDRNVEYSLLKKATDRIRENEAEVIEQKGSYVKIKAEGEYLLSTMMYDENWDITVNGAKAQPEKFMEYFMAVPLENGENTVEMVYTPPGLKAGLIMFFAGVTALVIKYSVLYMRKKII